MNSREKGFTLLEIMVAIFIFAILITTVFGSFRAVFSSTDAVGGDVDVFATARTCIARMATDLSSLYILDYPRYQKPEFNDEKEPYQFLGDTTDLAGTSFGRLRFTSLAHLFINGDFREGVTRIVYYVQERSDETLVLRRADHLFPFPEFEESEDDPILFENLVSLEFQYLDEEGEAHESWDSESGDTDYATPHALEIRLTAGSAERPLLFSTRVPLHVYRKPAQ